MKMKSRLLAAACLAATSCSVLGCASWRAGAHDDDITRASVDLAIAKVKPALVRIHTVSTHYRGGRELKFESVGSGVIITSEGHVITNHHVAGHAIRLFCTMVNREEIEAELVGTDPLTDIAVIKLKPEREREFPVARFGDSSKVRVGDRVLAMGSPLALSQSVTLGILSNTEMVMPARLEQDGENVGGLVRWFGHDAAIYGGNSGGPLVDIEGAIIGINEISFGLSGAIPGNLAKSVAEEIIERGSVRRSWFGVDIQPRLKSSTEQRGILIGSVIEGSPAKRAGIEMGDLVVNVGGADVNVRYYEEVPAFNRLIADLPIGEEVDVTVLRDGIERKLKLVTAERDPVQPAQRELKKWGITARDISFVMAKEMKRENQDGVLVTTVRPGGAVGDAKPQIQAGDVIVQVGSTSIENLDDLMRVTRELSENADERVPVLTTFERQESRYLTVVEVGLRELRAPGAEVKKAWLPIMTQVLSRDIARELGDQDLSGFRIIRIYADALPEGSDLEVGDLILAVDGEKLQASDPEDYEELPTLIREYPTGSSVELTIQRGDERRKASVKLARAPMPKREMKKYRDDEFEFTVRGVSFFDRAEQNWGEASGGVLVDDVRPGGWAALGSLGIGDLIEEVDGEKIDSVEKMKVVMDRIVAERPKSLVLRVTRGIHTSYLELQPDWGSPR